LILDLSTVDLLDSIHSAPLPLKVNCYLFEINCYLFEMGITRKEAEDLKPHISEAVLKVLGFHDSAIVMAAVNCLSNDLDKKSTIGKCSIICLTLKSIY